MFYLGLGLWGMVLVDPSDFEKAGEGKLLESFTL